MMNSSHFIRADRPATPSEDLACWSRSAQAAATILSPDVAEFCASGVSVIIAACGLDGRAIPGSALAARAEAGAAVRVLLRRPANQALIAAVEAGSPVAATFTRPSVHQSIQLKSSRGEVLQATAQDVEAAAVQTALFRDVLVGMGYTPAFSALYVHHAAAEVSVISFTPEQAFVQTPGPGAGNEVVR